MLLWKHLKEEVLRSFTVLIALLALVGSVVTPAYAQATTLNVASTLSQLLVAVAGAGVGGFVGVWSGAAIASLGWDILCSDNRECSNGGITALLIGGAVGVSVGIPVGAVAAASFFGGFNQDLRTLSLAMGAAIVGEGLGFFLSQQLGLTDLMHSLGLVAVFSAIGATIGLNLLAPSHSNASR
jgi:hypothetical protein